MARKRSSHGRHSVQGGVENGQLAHWRRIEMRRELAELDDNLREVWDDESDPEAKLELRGDHPARFYTDSDDEPDVDPSPEPDELVTPLQDSD